MENEFKGGLNTDVVASSIPAHLLPEEAKISWLGISDLKALLTHAKECQSQLTIQDGTDIHDYWHNVVEKTTKELSKQIFDIFPF